MKGKLLLGAAVAAGLLGVAALAGQAFGGGSRVRLPSRFAAEPEGLLGFARLLERLGRPVETRTTSWDDLADASPTNLLLVATPLQRAVDAREADALRRWLTRGGTLIVVDDATTLESSAELVAVLQDAGLGGSLPLPEINPAMLSIARPRTRASRGTPARPSGTDLKRISLHADGGIDPESMALPLAVGPSGATMCAEGTLGAGRIVRVHGPLLANDKMLAGDNLTFALRLIDDLRGTGAVVFDEYHHGFGGLLSGMRGLEPASLVWAGLQALAAGAVYALCRGLRFGPARPAAEAQRRSSLEYVRSMAALYRTAGSRRHALEAALRRFLREVRTRWGAAETLPIEALARLPAMASSGVPAARIASTLDAVQTAILDTSLGDRMLLERTLQLARLEEELFHGRPARAEGAMRRAAEI